MIRDMLELSTVQIARESETADGMGGFSTSTVLTTLSYAQIWQAGAANRYLSDRVTRASTHVLACETGEYSWAQDDRLVVYGAARYKITGRPDDIANQGDLTIVGLEQLT